jgi:hypothetical protein
LARVVRTDNHVPPFDAPILLVNYDTQEGADDSTNLPVAEGAVRSGIPGRLAAIELSLGWDIYWPGETHPRISIPVKKAVAPESPDWVASKCAVQVLSDAVTDVFLKDVEANMNVLQICDTPDCR